MEQHINELNFIERYLEYLKKTKNEETYLQRCSILRRFAKDIALREKPDEPITYEDIASFLNDNKLDLRSTIHQRYVAISLFYEWCELTLLGKGDISDKLDSDESRRFRGINKLVEIRRNAGRERLDKVDNINFDDFVELMRVAEDEEKNIFLLWLYFGWRVAEGVSMRDSTPKNQRINWLDKSIRIGVKTESSKRTLFFDDRIAGVMKDVLNYDWFKNLSKHSCAQRIRRMCEKYQPQFQRVLTPKSFRKLFYKEMGKSMLDKMLPKDSDRDKKMMVMNNLDWILDGMFMGHDKSKTEHSYTDFTKEELKKTWNECHFMNNYLSQK